MDQKMILSAMAIVLVVIAAYIAVSGAPKPPAANETAVGPDTKAAEAVLMKGLMFGYGQKDYVYSYGEMSDGYKTSYTLTVSGNQSLAQITNPLSEKKLYFLDNDTVLCIRFGSKEACSSIRGRDDMANYVDSIRVNFFNDTLNEKYKANIRFLIDKGYLALDPIVTSKASALGSCKAIKYTIDFNNATVSDGALFGIGASSPKVFKWEWCVDESTGRVFEKSFSYELNGQGHSYAYALQGLKTGSVEPVLPPQNISETDEAVQILMKEKQKQIVLANCYTTMSGDALDKCVSDMALELRRKDMCQAAGARKDRCLVSLVPLTKDETICMAVGSSSFKDDCYIELAGAFKNSTYCAQVLNQSKVDSCAKAATPVAQNATSGANGSAIDPGNLLNYIDKYNETSAQNNTLPDSVMKNASSEGY